MTAPTLPRVSVIAPCYNQAQFLDQHLSSVARATRAFHEVIIVDDGSTHPQTVRDLEVLRSAAPHQEIVLVRQSNAGLAAARNSGIRRSRGEYVKFLDADDLLMPGSLDIQMRHLERLRDEGSRPEQHSVSVCDYFTLNESNAQWELAGEQPSSLGRLTFDDIAFGWERGVSIPIHCGLFTRSVFGGKSPFDENLRSKEDWLFWMGLLADNIEPAFLPKPLAVYRIHGDSMTRKSNIPNASSWLEVAREAHARYPDLFTDDAYKAAITHFKTFYVDRLWRELGPSLPWQVCSRIVS